MALVLEIACRSKPNIEIAPTFDELSRRGRATGLNRLTWLVGHNRTAAISVEEPVPVTRATGSWSRPGETTAGSFSKNSPRPTGTRVAVWALSCGSWVLREDFVDVLARYLSDPRMYVWESALSDLQDLAPDRIVPHLPA